MYTPRKIITCPGWNSYRWETGWWIQHMGVKVFHTKVPYLVKIYQSEAEAFLSTKMGWCIANQHTM